MVVTSEYVTDLRLPILEVSHDDDGEGGELWQFHCGNGDYSIEKMRLGRLATILSLDPSLCAMELLPLGATAVRVDSHAPWQPKGV